MRLVRRFSETRRPHPMGRGETVAQSIGAELCAAGPDSQCGGYRARYDEVQCA